MKQGTGNREQGRGRGFSLIEILIAVLILALGLLGIAAVFPVVIREQRIGTENIMGVVVGNSARAILDTSQWDQALPTGATETVWQALRKNHTNGLSKGGSAPAYNGSGQAYELGEWYTFDLPALTADQEGVIVLGDPDVATNQVKIPTRSRLYPLEASGSQQPQFVWDIAVHRESDFIAGTGQDVDKLQMAVFVRRVDQRVRKTGNAVSLLQMFVDRSRLGAGEWRVPVGAIASGLDKGTPTLDGTDGNGSVFYSRPMTANINAHFQVNAARPQYLDNVDTSRVVGRLLAQPSQKLVDNLGNVYTVEGVEVDPANTSRSRLRLSPPLPVSIIQGATPRLAQFVFTAQVPVSVLVMEVPE